MDLERIGPVTCLEVCRFSPFRLSSADRTGNTTNAPGADGLSSHSHWNVPILPRMVEQR